MQWEDHKRGKRHRKNVIAATSVTSVMVKPMRHHKNANAATSVASVMVEPMKGAELPEVNADESTGSTGAEATETEIWLWHHQWALAAQQNQAGMRQATWAQATWAHAHHIYGPGRHYE